MSVPTRGRWAAPSPGSAIVLAVLLSGLVSAPVSGRGPAPFGPAETIAPSGAPGTSYPGPDGQPLPFADDDEVLEFLRTAEVVGQSEVGTGINHILRLELVKDGVRAFAAYRNVEDTETRRRLADGRVVMVARDSYRFEPAAYWLSRSLGLDMVPPAVLRSHHGMNGSFQLWVGNVQDENSRREKGDAPPDGRMWEQQNAMRRLFDNLIANYDRNLGNILVDRDSYRVWLIDHSRAFLADTKLLYPNLITHCERGVFERLQTLDPAELAPQLGKYLSKYEIRSLRKRWRQIESMLEEKIAESGKEAVLFEEPVF